MRYILYFMVKELNIFKRFDIVVKEKPQNVHLKLIFYHVLSRFNLRERIHDPVFVTQIAF